MGMQNTHRCLKAPHAAGSHGHSSGGGGSRMDVDHCEKRGLGGHRYPRSMSQTCHLTQDCEHWEKSHPGLRCCASRRDYRGERCQDWEGKWGDRGPPALWSGGGQPSLVGMIMGDWGYLGTWNCWWDIPVEKTGMCMGRIRFLRYHDHCVQWWARALKQLVAVHVVVKEQKVL